MNGAASAALAPLGLAYGGVARVRNWLYDRGILHVRRFGVPIVSIGNLTVGGTGKTPLVVWLVRRALAAGKRPGVLARGYGRAPGQELNDEGALLRGRFPELAQHQQGDRIAGASALLARTAVDYLILDDGFQHRRIGRDRDLVCIDSCYEGAADHMLPWGRLREPFAGLRRASAVVLTRAGHLLPEQRGELAARVRHLGQQLGGRELPVFACEHAPSRLVAMPKGESIPLTDLAGRAVVLLSAIARPQAFAQTVTSLGANVVAHFTRRDHHRHTPAQLAEAAERARAAGAWLVTTEKDEVKLTGLPDARFVLCVDVRFLGDEPSDSMLLLQ